MFPPGPWNTPAPSFAFPVPPPEHDPGTERDCVRVSFSREYLPYIMGALKQLWLASTWQGDEVAQNLAQDRAIELMTLFAQAESCSAGAPTDIGACCEDDCMSCIRVDCNCNVFIKCPDGTEVQLVTMNQSSGQPGAGSPQPKPGGGSSDYCFRLAGNSQAVLPTNVSSGDIITIHDTHGAWNDNVLPFWYCPDGNLFILGNCYPNFALNSLDPVPTVPHMTLVANIGGTFYNLNRLTFGGFGAFTIPPGIVNQPVVLQANIADISHGGGEITFCAMVQNNAIETWEQLFDFTLSPYGWSPQGRGGSPDAGIWTAGQGWLPSDVTETVGAGDSFRRADIFIDIPPTEITGVDVTYSIMKGSYLSGSDYGLFTQSDDTGGGHFYTNILNPALADTSGATDVENSTNASQIKLEAYLASSSANPAAFSGSLAIVAITVRGTGVNPFTGS